MLAEEQSIALVAHKCSRLASPDGGGQHGAWPQPSAASPAPSLASHLSSVGSVTEAELLRNDASPTALQLMRMLYHRRAKNRRLLQDQGRGR